MSVKTNENIIIPEEYLNIPQSYIETNLEPTIPVQPVSLRNPIVYRKIKNKSNQKPLTILEESQIIPEATIEDPSKYATIAKSKAYTRKNKSIISKLFKKDISDIVEQVKDKINETRKKEKKSGISKKDKLSNIDIQAINEDEIFALYTIKDKSDNIHIEKNIAYYYDIILKRKEELKGLNEFKYIFMFYISPFSDENAEKLDVRLENGRLINYEQLHGISYDNIFRLNILCKEARSEEHTSELQSLRKLVWRPLPDKIKA